MERGPTLSAMLDDVRHHNGLLAALGAARERYAQRRPASLRAHEAAQAVLPGGNTRTVLFHGPFPLTIARGEGARVWDVDGHAYLDLMGEYTAGLFGHSHPAILAAIRGALEHGLSLSGHTLAEARFAAGLVARFPAMERLRFTNSGTEANLMALAAATAFTGRRTVLACHGGYHGGVLSFGTPDNPVNVPHRVVLVPYNDAAAAARAAEAHAADLAAIIVEPLQGAGGCIPGDPAFLATLRAQADATGALLIFDEVMTSRLAPGGLGAALGLRPDLMTLGKYLAGGLSFGAFGGRAEIMNRFDPRRPGAWGHAGTFNNNVLSMAAGLAALDAYDDADCAALNARGDRLRHALNALAAARGLALTATGRGSMLTLHPGGPQALADAVKELLFLDLLEAGVSIARRGMVALSLPVTEADLDGALAALAEILDARRDLLPGAAGR
jgi:glutamate-1-semialdehyde 2,1-aminomutase